MTDTMTEIEETLEVIAEDTVQKDVIREDAATQEIEISKEIVQEIAIEMIQGIVIKAIRENIIETTETIREEITDTMMNVIREIITKTVETMTEMTEETHTIGKDIVIIEIEIMIATIRNKAHLEM